MRGNERELGKIMKRMRAVINKWEDEITSWRLRNNERELEKGKN